MEKDKQLKTPIWWGNLIFISVSSCSCGSLFIFIFTPQLFTTMNNFLLVLLSFSITFPFVLVNTVLSMASHKKAGSFPLASIHEIFSSYLYSGGANMAIMFCLTIASGYLFGFSARVAVIVLFVLEILFFLFARLLGKTTSLY